MQLLVSPSSSVRKRAKLFFLRFSSLAPLAPLSFVSFQTASRPSWLFLAFLLESQIKAREGVGLGHSSVQTFADGLARRQTSRLVFVRAAGPQPQPR